MKTPLRVVWFGIYDPSYPRNDVLMSGLQANGVEIIQCRDDWRARGRYWSLFRRLRALQNDYDVIYAAFPATLPTILAKLISRRPVVKDALYSMYDAVVNDRAEVSWYNFRAIKLWLLDWVSALMADRLIVDTKAHADYWSKFPGVKRSKIKVVYLGIQPERFAPEPDKPRRDFLVSFHGHYIPLQGVPKIVEAARLLRDNADLKFRLIGAGQLSRQVTSLIEAYALTSVEQTGMVPPAEVARYCQEADIILGSFGDTEKVKRVIPLKVYEGLALGKPVITMDTPAVREMFTSDEVLMVSNTPEAIAKAILTLKEDQELRKRLATQGRAKVIKCCTPAVIGKTLYDYLLFR